MKIFKINKCDDETPKSNMILMNNSGVFEEAEPQIPWYQFLENYSNIMENSVNTSLFRELDDIEDENEELNIFVKEGETRQTYPN